MNYEITIKCDVYPDYSQKVGGVYDLRLAVAKVMADWNLYCTRMRKDQTKEIAEVEILVKKLG